MSERFKILKPRLSAEIEESSISNVFELNEGELCNLLIQNITLDSFNMEGIKLDSCHFINVNFNSNILQKVEIIDCIFDNCDLSNVNFSGSNIHRVSINNSKLLGSDFSEANFKNVEINNSMCEYANFSYSHFKLANIIKCHMENTYFNNVSFDTVSIEYCNLLQADFYETNLKDIDFSTDEIGSIKLSGKELKGAIVSLIQTVDLAKLLGVKIKEEIE